MIVINYIVKKCNFTYTFCVFINDKVILIDICSKLLFLFSSLPTIIYSQTQTIEGFVFDVETSEPLSYANVRIDGTTKGTSANINGQI